MGPGSATSLTQKWCFVEQDNEAFVGPCSQRGPAPTLTMGLKILVRAGRGGLKADGPSVWRLFRKYPISQHPGAAGGPGTGSQGGHLPWGLWVQPPRSPVAVPLQTPALVPSLAKQRPHAGPSASLGGHGILRDPKFCRPSPIPTGVILLESFEPRLAPW